MHIRGILKRQEYVSNALCCYWSRKVFSDLKQQGTGRVRMRKIYKQINRDLPGERSQPLTLLCSTSRWFVSCALHSKIVFGSPALGTSHYSQALADLSHVVIQSPLSPSFPLEVTSCQSSGLHIYLHPRICHQTQAYFCIFQGIL